MKRKILAFILPLLLGISIGIASSAGVWAVQHDQEGWHPVPQPAASLGFKTRPFVDRYPALYCLFFMPGQPEAADVIEGPLGWGRVDDSVQVQVAERCSRWWEVNVWFFLDSNRPSWCAGSAACVTFDNWHWTQKDGWMSEVCSVHVEPNWWATASSYWRKVLLAHEWGHCYGLADVGYADVDSIMDYVWDQAYPTAKDIVEVETMYSPYHWPAWLHWLKEHS